MTVRFEEDLVANLNSILPTYYELAVDSSIQTPCLTWRGYSDISADQSLGLGLRYSRPSYQIKVWGDKLKELKEYGQQLDDLMFELGFVRIGYQELSYNTQIQLVYNYTCLFRETIQ